MDLIFAKVATQGQINLIIHFGEAQKTTENIKQF
jgi:hypothetical protein